MAPTTQEGSNTIFVGPYACTLVTHWSSESVVRAKCSVGGPPGQYKRGLQLAACQNPVACPAVQLTCLTVQGVAGVYPVTVLSVDINGVPTQDTLFGAFTYTPNYTPSASCLFSLLTAAATAP